MSTIDRLHESQQKLTDEVAESNVRTATIELRTQLLSENFTAFREENERHQSTQTERMDALFTMLQNIRAETHKQKWRPVHYVAIITSLITSSGLAITAWISTHGSTIKGVIK